MNIFNKPIFRIFFIAGYIIFLLLIRPGAGASKDQITQIDIIFDASGSMYGDMSGRTKIQVAKEVLCRLMEELEKKPLYVALRVYGHLNKKCSNTVLEIPMEKINAAKIKKKVMPLKPKGRTPISYSLLLSPGDFRKDIEGEKVVILITDGIETCRGNPCEVAQKLKNEGIVTKIHVVGFGMGQKELLPLHCIVKPSGGIVVTANTADELNRALAGIVEESIKKNLIITGNDKNGQNIYIYVDVLRNDQKLLSSEGMEVGFNLEAGIYNLIISREGSGEKIPVNEIVVSDDAVARKNVVFGLIELIVTGLDSSGKSISTIAVIHDNERGDIVEIQEKDFVHRSVLKPGTYDIEVQDLETNEIQWLKGIKIEYGIVRKDVSFKRGYCAVISENRSGNLIKTTVDIYDAGTGKLIKNSPGKTRHDFILPVGTFNFNVKYWYSKAEVKIPGIVIHDGETLEKKVVIDTE